MTKTRFKSTKLNNALLLILLLFIGYIWFALLIGSKSFLGTFGFNYLNPLFGAISGFISSKFIPYPEIIEFAKFIYKLIFSAILFFLSIEAIANYDLKPMFDRLMPKKNKRPRK